MDEILLLGAGASAEAGIPPAIPMTKDFIRNFRESEFQKHLEALYFVLGGLLFQKGAQGDDPFDGINVEELFSAIEMLGDRRNLEVLPFLGQWHPRVYEIEQLWKDPATEILSTVQSIEFPRWIHLESAIADAAAMATPGMQPDEIRELFEGRITNAFNITLREYVMPFVNARRKAQHQEWLDRLSGKNEGYFFRQVAADMLYILRQMIWLDDPGKVGYLKPIFNLLKSQKKLVIATLNYDNSIESAAKTLGVAITDGIDGWREDSTLLPPDEGVFLLKLHGSIDWILHTADPENLTSPWEIRRGSQFDLRNKEKPALVFGQRSKLRADGPFLDLLHCFIDELSRASLLTVVGYSFFDDHINMQISKWMKQDERRKIRVISPSFQETPSPYGRDLQAVYASRIEVITAKAGEGLQRVYGT